MLDTVCHMSVYHISLHPEWDDHSMLTVDEGNAEDFTRWLHWDYQSLHKKQWYGIRPQHDSQISRINSDGIPQDLVISMELV